MANGEIPNLLFNERYEAQALGGMPSAGGLSGTTTGPITRELFLRIVPSIEISERYDSNVYSAPGSFVPGQKLWDFVTAATPQVAVLTRGELIEGSLTVGASGNTYVNNRQLNYISANAGLNMNMDKLADRFVRGARLQVSEFFLFTPQPPAFLTPRDEGQASDAFVRGIQPFRADSYSNTASVTGSYTVSPLVNLQSGYTYSIFRYGKTFVTSAPIAFFGTTSHTATGGLAVQLSRLDTANLTYVYSQSEFEGGSGSDGSSGFKTHAGTASYTRLLTRSVTATFGGGITKVEPGDSLPYTINASLAWSPDANNRLTISYSRAVAPSFFLAASALVSQILSASVTRQLTTRVSVTGSANYARNESTGSGAALLFQSYGTSFGLNYALTRELGVSLSHTYNNFMATGVGQDIKFDRNVVVFAISGRWQ